jgi:hypothetical protein
LVLCVENGHRQAPLCDLPTDHPHGLRLVLQLVGYLQALCHCGETKQPLALAVVGGEASASVAGSGCVFLPLLGSGDALHYPQVLASVRFHAHIVSRLDVARSVLVEQEAAGGAFETNGVDFAVCAHLFRLHVSIGGSTALLTAARSAASTRG